MVVQGIMSLSICKSFLKKRWPDVYYIDRLRITYWVELWISVRPWSYPDCCPITSQTFWFRSEGIYPSHYGPTHRPTVSYIESIYISRSRCQLTIFHITIVLISRSRRTNGSIVHYTLQLLSKSVYTCLSVRLAVKHFYDNTKVAVQSQPDRFYSGVKWWIQNIYITAWVDLCLSVGVTIPY